MDDFLGRAAELFARVTAKAQSYEGFYIRDGFRLPITVIPDRVSAETFRVEDDFHEDLPFDWILPFPQQLRLPLGYYITPERGDRIEISDGYAKGEYVVRADLAGLCWSPVDQTQRMIVVHTAKYSDDLANAPENPNAYDQ